MPTAGKTHDITLENATGAAARRGFMLKRDRRGGRGWQVKDSQTIAPRQMTMGEMTQAELPPDIQLVWYQNNFSGGIGGRLARTHPDQVNTTVENTPNGLDLSQPGRILPGRIQSSNILGTAATTNQGGGFALVEPGTSGLSVLWCTVGRNLYSMDSGGSSWTIDGGALPQARDVVYRNAVQYGRRAYMPAWDASKDSNRNTNAAVGTTATQIDVSSDPTGAIAVDDIVQIDSEKMRVTAISVSPANMTVTRAWGGTVAATHATATDILLVGTSAMFEGDPAPYIYKPDAPNAVNWTLTNNANGRFKFFAKTRNAAGDEVLWGGNNIYDSTLLINDAANINATQTTITVDTADATVVTAVGDILRIDVEKMLLVSRTATVLTVVRGYGGTVARSHNDNTGVFIYAPHGIRSSTNPANGGSWSSLATFGIDQHPITALVADGDTLLVCKTNGIWTYYPDGTSRNLTPEIENQVRSDNFLAAYNWNGHVILPLGPGGLLDLHNGVLNDISPRILFPEDSKLHGRVSVIVGDSTRLWLLIESGDSRPDQPYLAGLELGDDGAFRWIYLARWTVMITGDRTTRSLFIDTHRPDHKRLWQQPGNLSGASSPESTYFGLTGDDRSDAFSTTSEIISIKDDRSLPHVNKQYASLELETINLVAGSRTIAVSYRLDNSTGAWTSLGTFNSSPLQTINFPAATTGKVIELRFAITNTPNTTGAAILSWRMTSQLRPAAVKLYPFTVYLAAQQMLLNGAIAGAMLGDLRQLRTWNGQAAEVILRIPPGYRSSGAGPPLGTSMNCVFLPGTLVEKEMAHEYARRGELACSFVLAEV